MNRSDATEHAWLTTQALWQRLEPDHTSFPEPIENGSFSAWFGLAVFLMLACVRSPLRSARCASRARTRAKTPTTR